MQLCKLHISKLSATLLLVLSIISFKVYAGNSINAYYGHYSLNGKRAGFVAPSLGETIFEPWRSIKPIRPYKIAVLLPHLEDGFWLAVNRAIIERAKVLGVRVKFFSAGGYTQTSTQLQQLNPSFIDSEFDGIIVAPTSYAKLDNAISDLAKNQIPAVSLINDIAAEDISGKVTMSYYDVGYKLGMFIAKDIKSNVANIVFLPGPADASWAAHTEQGFFKAIADNSNEQNLEQIKLVAKEYADATYHKQHALLEYILSKKQNIDYVICNPSAALAAPEILTRFAKLHPNIKVVSTYMIPELYPLLKSNLLYAAASAEVKLQSEIALDMLVRICNGENYKIEGSTMPFRISPQPMIYSAKELALYPYESLFGPISKNPILEYNMNM